MMNCFQGGAVVSSLCCNDKYGAIKELICRAPVFSEASDKRELEEAVIQREKILSTGLGRGVAVAHGTTSTVERLIIALGFSKQGIEFDAVDKAPVHLLFVIANPPEKQRDYLRALASVATMMRNADFRKYLTDNDRDQDLEQELASTFRDCLDKYRSKQI
jgi:mannitol/fructose-specific phosphotransferase system IIA component (Ntr-type)